MKATSIFGGVQVFNIIITIVRSKFVAVLLGPAGMGIAGLLNATLSIIGSFTNFGLATSAVKNVAAANATANEQRIAVVVAVLRRLVWVTGILGAIVTFAAAPWLSKLTFGNEDYTYAFIWLSLTLFIGQISVGQVVILRGLRKIQLMAKASMIGSIIGLMFSIPLYYMYGKEGIVPAILVTSLLSLLISWYFSSKVELPKVQIDRETLHTEGREMLSMGFLLSMSGLVAIGASYIVRVYISNTGGVEQVGLYNAGFAIVNSYVGMVFSAMSTDYYPRLSAVAHNKEAANRTITEQAEVSILILAPILVVFLVFINWVVQLMYSTKFIPVSGMIHWAALGIYFKAVGWAIAFIMLAKSSSKLYFWNEFIANIYLLGFNVIGYYLGGLDGLGVSFLVSYIIYVVQVFLVSKVKYGFRLTRSFYNLFGAQLAVGIVAFVVVKVADETTRYIVGSALIIASTVLSYRGLDKRMDMKSILRRIASKFKK